MERSQVRFGRTVIEYTIERGNRLKTVAIGVDPIEGVVVRAPEGTSMEKLDGIVHRKATWILDRLRRLEDLPPPPSPRAFVSGETFLYLGRQYRLKRRRGNGDVKLDGPHLFVSAKTPKEACEQLVTWYRAHADARLPMRVAHWSAKLNVQPTTVLIRDPRKRWGSADAKGNVRFNWRIVQAPTRLIDYVVAHELVHLSHADHTRDFWATLGRAMPDYEARREALRRLGRMMVW